MSNSQESNLKQLSDPKQNVGLSQADMQKSESVPRGELMPGTVKWFNDAKGFGFIEHSSGRDVFVHYSVIETEGFKTLKDGEAVFYSLAEGDKGLHAARVVRDPAVVKSTTKVKGASGATEDPMSGPAIAEAQLGDAYAQSIASQIEVESIAERIDDSQAATGAHEHPGTTQTTDGRRAS